MDGYDNFFLPVNDMARAREYYQNLLGLDVKFDFSDKGMLAYRVGQEEPALILKEITRFPDAKTYDLVRGSRRQHGVRKTQLTRRPIPLSPRSKSARASPSSSKIRSETAWASPTTPGGSPRGRQGNPPPLGCSASPT